MEVVKKVIKWVLILVVVLIAVAIILPKVTGNGESVSSLEKKAIEAYKSKDMQKAETLLLEACKKGSAKSCALASNIYLEKHEYKKALIYASKSADQGYAIGYFELAIIYNDGLGVEQDNLKAKELYQKSCNLGFPMACKVLKRNF